MRPGLPDRTRADARRSVETCVALEMGIQSPMAASYVTALVFF
jgi:hypothetical protein